MCLVGYNSKAYSLAAIRPLARSRVRSFIHSSRRTRKPSPCVPYVLRLSSCVCVYIRTWWIGVVGGARAAAAAATAVAVAMVDVVIAVVLYTQYAIQHTIHITG